jgi:hypothetical protein
VTGLIGVAQAFLLGGPVNDLIDAGYGDVEADSYWGSGMYDYPSPSRQYCFNVVDWYQNGTINPSSFYGIQVWAKVSLPPNNPFDVLDIWVGPIYLRIHRSHALSISATSGGNTEPYPGTYHYYEGTSVTVTAFAYSGYTFDHWLLDGSIYYQNPITVTMNSDHNLKAYFYYSGGGGGGCPILSVWDGIDYVCEGLLDIHNSEGVDVVYNHTLVTTPQRVHGAYLFRLIEHPQTISHIDQVKLYAILKDKTTIELPLIWAWHSEDGNILPQLLFSDDWKAETLGANWNNGVSQSIDLKFAALPPKVKAIAFIFQIEGNNPYFKT